MEFKDLTSSDATLLSEFLTALDNDVKSFRYFRMRNLDIVDDHLVSLLLLDSNAPIAYGHIDPENGINWLGIAVAKTHQGRGLGKMMISELIRRSQLLGLKTITLSVDNDNHRAIALYEKVGFRKDKESSGNAYYNLQLN